MKFRVPLLDSITREEVDKEFYFDPSLKELGLTVEELRPKYHNLFRASFETAIWCEGEKAADAMNRQLEGRMSETMAVGLHGGTTPNANILGTLSNVKTHVLFPDHDEAGTRAMDNLERSIRAILPHAAIARVQHPEDAAPKSDAYEYGPSAVDMVLEAMGNSTKQVDAEPLEVEAPALTRKKPTPVEPEFYIGLIGEAVNRLDPHTEASREALHMTLLTGLCPMLGIHPKIPQPIRATPNLFTCIVGKQFSGKKGTSWLDIEENFLKPLSEQLDLNEDWINSRVTNVESGQAIVSLVHHGDPNRLFVISEFKSLFDAMTRDSSNVDSVLRQAWDRESLQVNRARDTLRADDANISFITHVTPDELAEQVRAVWASNGVLRRWLWCYSESSKEVNKIMESNIAIDIVDRLALAIKYARRHTNVNLSPEAWAYWTEWRRSLVTDDESFITKASAGHESRVSRIMLVLALLDEEHLNGLPSDDRTVGEVLSEGPSTGLIPTRELVQLKHLKAAIRWNQYSTDTLEYVFRNKRWDKVTQKIYDFLEDVKELSLSQIQSQIFKGNINKDEIRTAGEKLERAGIIKRILRRNAGQTKGRRAEIWIMIKQAD